MNTPRLFLAAIAATLLSTAAMASPPPAQAVTVPQGEMGRHSKMQAVFGSDDARMMFKMQMREATKGMTREQKKAYRKDQIHKIKGMTDAEKASWRHDLQAKWDTLPADKKAKMTQKMERHAEKHADKHHARANGGQRSGPDSDQDMNTPQ